MDLKPVFLPKSPPPAHKQHQRQEVAHPSKDQQHCALDLSYRPNPGDAPLDLTLENKPKPLIPPIPTSWVPPVPTTPDDDVIVVDVKRGRGVPSIQKTPGGSRTVYNMCQKETYTGGVAYTPFDLSAGLIKLKQMMRMAKDPQQARQIAQTFQKRALHMILKSRIQQQQRQTNSGNSEAGPSSSSMSFSSASSSCSRSFLTRQAPSAALGRPMNLEGTTQSVTPISLAAENCGRISEGSPVVHSGVSSAPSTSVQVIQPVLVVTSINAMSRMNSPFQVTSGNPGSSAHIQTDKTVHSAFAQRGIPALSLATSCGSYASVTVASGQVSTTMTSPSVGSSSSSTSAYRNNPMPKVSSAANFESEYMKYVRSKRFMSGGSNITEEKKSLTGTPEFMKVENTSMAKKMARPSMEEYHYVLSEINKMTKNAVAETIHKAKRLEGNTPSGKVAGMMSPPPAHSKIPVNVNHKMPHRNPHLFRCPQIRPGPQNSQSVSKYLSQMGYVSKTTQPKLYPQGSKISPPEKVEPSTAVSTAMASRPVVSNVKTWTPPVGKKPYVKQIINEENMNDVGELIRIPHFKFAERKSPVKDDKEEFQRIYSTGEEMDSSTNESSSVNSSSESMPLRLENSQTDFSERGKKGRSVQNNDLVSVNVSIEVHSGATPRTSQVLNYGPKSSSLVIPPPVTKVIAPNTINETPLNSDVVMHCPITTTIPKSPAETVPAALSLMSARKTVVKPVTSTFIGWNVNGYKRIPVANVNPIKVQEGAQIQLDITANMAGTMSSQISDTQSQVSASIGNTHSPGLESNQRGLNLSKTGNGVKCLILPKPDISSEFEHFSANQVNQQMITASSAIVKTSNELTTTSDASMSVSATTTIPKEEVAKPKKRKKTKERDGTEGKRKQQKVILKPKVKKMKEKVENIESSKPCDGGSGTSVYAKTEAIKAILRDDFKIKVPEVDVQRSGSQAGSPAPKRNKAVVRTKGVCFHSDEESDGKKLKKDIILEDAEGGGVGPIEAGVKVKRRKRSKNLLKHKSHRGKKKLKATQSDEDKRVASYIKQEVENQEVNPIVGDSRGNLTGPTKLVVKISKKKRKRKTKVATCDSNRERCSQLITYNKNAKYEQELLRDEERRLVLKAKRQARKSVRSDSSPQSDAGCGNYGEGFEYLDEDSYNKFGSSENSWQGGAGYSGNHGDGSLYTTTGGAGQEEEIQYEVESQPMDGRQRLHTGLKLKRIVRKVLVDDQLETGTFADEEDSGFHRRRLKRRRRRRWYKKRKPFVYVPVNYQLCMGEVDDNQYESHCMPVESVDAEHLMDPESGFPEAFVDPELIAELKGVFTCRETGETKLHRLTRMGHQELAIRCIEAKLFSVNARDHAGYTPLHESCVTGRLRVAKSLLKHGADVNKAAQDGTRPLHDAVDHNRLELVRLLLAHGADPHTSTYSGKTPLKIARTPDMQRLIKGHLQDVSGVKHKDRVDIWTFTPPWEDKVMEHLGCDVLQDPPSDSSSGEEDVEFELWDSTPLSCHYLELDQEQGHRNYYLLHDLSSLKDIPEDDFKLLNFDLSYRSATRESFSQQIGSDDNTLLDSVFGNSKKVDFAEASSSLKSLLEIDRCDIARSELTDGNLNDLSFSETPTERLLLEGSVPTNDSTEPSDLNPTACCSRKLDFSQTGASNKPLASGNSHENLTKANNDHVKQHMEEKSVSHDDSTSTNNEQVKQHAEEESVSHDESTIVNNNQVEQHMKEESVSHDDSRLANNVQVKQHIKEESVGHDDSTISNNVQVKQHIKEESVSHDDSTIANNVQVKQRIKEESVGHDDSTIANNDEDLTVANNDQVKQHIKEESVSHVDSTVSNNDEDSTISNNVQVKQHIKEESVSHDDSTIANNDHANQHTAERSDGHDDSTISNNDHVKPHMEDESVIPDNSGCSDTKASVSLELECSKTIGAGGDNSVNHGTGKAQEVLACSENCDGRGDGIDGDNMVIEEKTRAEETESVKECSSGSLSVVDVANEEGEEEPKDVQNDDDNNKSLMPQEGETDEPVKGKAGSDVDYSSNNEHTTEEAAESISNNGSLCGPVLQEKTDKLSQVDDTKEKAKNTSSCEISCVPETSQEDQSAATNSEISSNMPVSLPSTSSLNGNKVICEDNGDGLALRSTDESLTVQQHQQHGSTEEALPVLEKLTDEGVKVMEKQEAEVPNMEKKVETISEGQGEEMPCLTPCV